VWYCCLDPNPVYTKHDQDALTERENIWRAHGMPEETQAFAAMLYRTTVAPVQALFDAGCTDYADDRAHIAIAPLLRNSSVTVMNLPTTTATLDPRP
jgi:hypothetical protein